MLPISPTDHQIWQISNDKDDLNVSKPEETLGILNILYFPIKLI